MASAQGRTALDFQTAAEIWQILDTWAQQTGYKLIGQDQASRLYQRGTGFWVAPQMLQVSWAGQGYHLEAWVRVPLFNRIVTFGLMPEELVISSGGFVGSLPRKTARNHVNILLQTLGLPPIP
jgi:hypothetical protein